MLPYIYDGSRTVELERIGQVLKVNGEVYALIYSGGPVGEFEKLTKRYGDTVRVLVFSRVNKVPKKLLLETLKRCRKRVLLFFEGVSLEEIAFIPKDERRKLLGIELKDMLLSRRLLQQVASIDGLGYLGLTECSLGTGSVDDLSLGGKSLQQLHVINTRIGDAGMAWIGGLRKLQYLRLFNGGFSGQGVGRLASLIGLRSLALGQFGLKLKGAEGALILTNSRLKRLELEGVEIGVKTLSWISKLSQLEHLYLCESKYPREAAMKAVEGLSRISALECLPGELVGRLARKDVPLSPKTSAQRGASATVLTPSNGGHRSARPTDLF